MLAFPDKCPEETRAWLPVWQLYSDPRILNVKGIDGFACLGLHSPGGTFFTASLNLILGHLQSVVFNMARRQTSTLPECGNRAQKFFLALSECGLSSHNQIRFEYRQRIRIRKVEMNIT